MIQFQFFIRFRAQLRRTKPRLIETLEAAVTNAVNAAGGQLESSHKILSASFDERRICFWLDMLIFLERVHKILEKPSAELFGYAVMLGSNIPEKACRKLSSPAQNKKQGNGSGIWCSGDVRDALDFAINFNNFVQQETEDTSVKFWELAGFKALQKKQKEFRHQDKIEQALAREGGKNFLLIGPEFTGKRESIYRRCRGLFGDAPLLSLRFGAGGRGLICFVDAWTQEMRSFIARANSEETIAELDKMHEGLFLERLREEWSPYMIEQGRRFMHCFFTAYLVAAKTHKSRAVIIIENISQADETARRVFKEVYSVLANKSSGSKPQQQLLLLATDSSAEESLRDWAEVFPRVLKLSYKDISGEEKNGLKQDVIPQILWEASYLFYLLNSYFPPHLFPRLLEEEGINRDIYFRALDMLEALGLAACTCGEAAGAAKWDIRLKIPEFKSLAENALGGRRQTIRSLVRNRILAWALSDKLRPCFNLLVILSELGERAGDALILRSLRADIINGTMEGIEAAIKQDYFPLLVGEKNAPVLTYIYKTLKALVWGNSREIQLAFNEPVPPLLFEDSRRCYGSYEALIMTNIAAFHIGCRNTVAASEAARKAMLLGRGMENETIPAHRLFSLVNFSRQRINDALEYISFAMDKCAKTEQDEEIVLTFYYSASINFLYGNLSKAESLSKRAEEYAVGLGQSEWEKRSRFLRARLCFEIGRYGEALEIFESLVSMESGNSAEMNRTVNAWVFRTKNYLGRFSQSNDADLAGHDAALFKIEAAYFTADYKRTVKLAEDFLASPGDITNKDFLFTEQPDWRSGFSQCEYMFQPEKVPGAHFAWIYKTLAECALRPPREEKAEILAGMQRFMREELLPDTDPSDAFYFYAWYTMLLDTGAAQVDMNTVVSMAYKRLQRRAGRIDDFAVKKAFLSIPRHTSTLCLAAREFMLV